MNKDDGDSGHMRWETGIGQVTDEPSIILNTVKPHYNEDLGTLKITLF